MRILITGPQGSGKTTQAKLISAKMGLCLVKTGDLIREKAAENSDIGCSLKEAIDKGNLVDNAVLADMLREKFNKPECRSGFVVDGYPRSLPQLAVFDPGYDLVFYLNISDEEAKKRLLARGREDDTPEAIEERLKIYHRQTKQVLDYYRDLGKLVEVNGEQPVGKVTISILERLGKIFNG